MISDVVEPHGQTIICCRRLVILGDSGNEFSVGLLCRRKSHCVVWNSARLPEIITNMTRMNVVSGNGFVFVSAA